MMWRAQFGILLLACSAVAGTLDGRWSVEVTPRSSKGTPAASVGTIFEFRTNGNQLNGSVIPMEGRTPHALPIINGTIDGDHFFFTTFQSSKKSGTATTTEWEGTVQGDEVSGKRTSDGKRRTHAAFKGKRQS